MSYQKSAFGLVYQIETLCTTPTCVFNQTAFWSINLTNLGEDYIEVTSFELVDYYSTKTFASYKYLGQPTAIYSNAPGGINIQAGESYLLNISGNIPTQKGSRNIIFFPCFSVAVKPTDTYFHSKNINEISYCSKANESLYAVQCIEDSHCNANENCILNNCIKFSCDECQYISNHTCQNYQCCSDNECSNEQYCYNNTCSNLACEDNEQYFNHTCTKLECNSTEYIFNHTCTSLMCQDDEGFVNNTCQKLECADDEYLIPHSCLKLNCTDTQGYLDHQCFSLNCNTNETFFNHTCVSLNCYFFQDIKNHTCITNTSSLLMFILELILVLGIALFLILDLLKVEKKAELKPKQ